MPEARHWYLFMYDVSEPTRLRKTHKLLSSWGKALQYSIFRVRGTKREYERLLYELSKVITSDDRLTTVRLCNSCVDHVRFQGPELAPFETDFKVTHIF